MNEGCGIRIADISGSRNDGSYVNAVSSQPLWSGGRSGPTLNFAAGGSQRVDIQKQYTPLDVTGDRLSFSLWAQATVSGANYLLGTINGAGTSGFSLNAPNDTSVRFIIGDGALVSMNANIKGTFSSGVWQHFCCVYDGAFLRIYQNGISIGTPVANTGNVVTNANKLQIGAYGESGLYWTGRLDNVQVWNRALSADEVRLLYASPFCNVVRPVTWVSSGVIPPASISPVLWMGVCV